MKAFPVTPCLHERFETAAARNPDAVALRFDGAILTYRALNQRANRLAHRLRRMGVGPDVLVALSTERTLDLVVGVVGILKAGGAYVPLDPAYPQDRLAFMLEDSGSRILVTSGESVSFDLGLVPHPVELVRIEDTAGEPEDNLPNRTGPDNLTYIIYTSGSTGKPKGVQITHANVVRLFTATEHWFHYGAEDVWPLFHSCCFDLSVWEIWGSLMYGGTLVVVPYWISRSPSDFLDLLINEKVTFLTQTPSAFRGLQAAELDRTDSRPLSLRTIVFAGEALELQGLRPWFGKHGDKKPLLVNMYGITETTVHSSYRVITLADLDEGVGSMIGVPIPDLDLLLLDDKLNPVGVGETGEICVAGAGLARGYLNRPELNAVRFIEIPGPEGKPLRVYRSGDLARKTPDGDMEYLGRSDFQVKIRGFRVELGEIESVIAQNLAVKAVVVLARDDARGDKRLVAYVVSQGDQGPLTEELRKSLRERVPEYMVPAAFVYLPKLPLTENGKVNRGALPEPGAERPPMVTEYEPPKGSTEETLALIWADTLALEKVGVNDSFFDLGGSSFLAVETLARIDQKLGRRLQVVNLFQHPTVRGLSLFIDVGPQTSASLEAVWSRRRRVTDSGNGRSGDVAIIGLSGRFPGSADIPEFWRHLCEGAEGITFFSYADLDPKVNASVPGYVKARGILPGADLFDAKFFGEATRSASLIDPQQRVLLEEVWSALEDAGVVPDRSPGTIGVFVGVGHNTYLIKNIARRTDLFDLMGDLPILMANDKDFVASRIAYKMDLHGPAVSIHTACSTSLVAVCEAVANLRRNSCDIAVAGAASVTVPQNSGHVFEDGNMMSSDGHTRSFDADADGTVFSDGAAVVVLKRLTDAVRDKDRIYAVIRGAAVNNDGSKKASFAAPSVSGQAEVVALAQSDAGIDPATISYVEAHGTATPLGDPVEIEALTQAFRAKTSKTGFCALGSVKSNIGHLTAASGTAGLVKTALALFHRQIPGTLHFNKPNPAIDFTQTPFYVQTGLTDWESPQGALRRAGVSSFGVGGTNAHVVLEEAPQPGPRGEVRAYHLLVLSAKTPTALESATNRLGAFLEANPGVDVADVSYTLQARRSAFSHRRFVVCRNLADAVDALSSLPAENSGTRTILGTHPSLAFVFRNPGAGIPDSIGALYTQEPYFRKAFDICAQGLKPLVGRDLREGLSGGLSGSESLLQPALFAIHYSLACLWRSWGIEPDSYLGTGTGELVSACLAGVFTLEGGLELAAARGRLWRDSAAFGDLVRKADPQAPRIRFVSGVTGNWISGAEATDPGYWANQLTAAGNLAGGLRTLDEKSDRIVFDVTFEGTGGAALARSLGNLWLSGVQPDWEALHAGGNRRVVSLPSYPFEGHRCWVD